MFPCLYYAENITEKHINSVCTMDVPTLVFFFWPKIALLKVLCGRMHCYDNKFSSWGQKFGVFHRLHCGTCPIT